MLHQVVELDLPEYRRITRSMRTLMELSSFRNLHKHQTIIVCGCGESLRAITKRPNCITIGVNDIGRLFTPNYLLVCDYQYCFDSERWDYVNYSLAQYCFTPLPYLQLTHKCVVRFPCGTYAGTDLSSHKPLHYADTSLYMALCLAAYMGGNPIGVTVEKTRVEQATAPHHGM